jgi:hypothetical protein
VNIGGEPRQATQLFEGRVLEEEEVQLDEEMSKLLREKMEERASELFGKRSDVRGSVLTIGTIMEAKQKFARLDRLYVCASEAIPKDAYGILMIRPEDMADWRKPQPAREE